MLIKICGVRDPEIARFAAEAGANFIGMILTPGYRRSVDLDTAKKIADAARLGGAEAVAVFVSEDPSEVERICELLCVNTVQYYQEAVELPKRYARFRINHPTAPLREGIDHLLLESGEPGTGTPIDETVEFPKDRSFILAGGLNPQNVREKIARHTPCGVDVSSGVEEQGQKSKALIIQFIREARIHDN